MYAEGSTSLKIRAFRDWLLEEVRAAPRRPSLGRAGRPSTGTGDGPRPVPRMPSEAHADAGQQLVAVVLMFLRHLHIACSWLFRLGCDVRRSLLDSRAELQPAGFLVAICLCLALERAP